MDVVRCALWYASTRSCCFWCSLCFFFFLAIDSEIEDDEEEDDAAGGDGVSPSKPRREDSVASKVRCLKFGIDISAFFICRCYRVGVHARKLFSLFSLVALVEHRCSSIYRQPVERRAPSTRTFEASMLLYATPRLPGSSRIYDSSTARLWHLAVLGMVRW